MADSNTLKVMSIFEVCSRLELGAEITCLAAHIYHRFFKLEQICKNIHLFELYTLASASIKLALCFYEKKYDAEGLCLAMINTIHGPHFYLDSQSRTKLEHSIDLMAKVMSINLNFQINHKDTRWTTPGVLNQRYRSQTAAEEANRRTIVEITFSSEDETSSSSSDDEDSTLSKIDRLLAKNDKYQISSHRYLAHYLKTIKMLVKPEAIGYFTKIANVAWTFLSDFHWSPCVTGICNNHLACASLMMAIEVYREEMEKSKTAEKTEFWHLVNKKWNFIFCDDFNSDHLQRAADTIIEQYREYDRVIQHELSIYVIDPLRR